MEAGSARGAGTSPFPVPSTFVADGTEIERLPVPLWIDPMLEATGKYYTHLQKIWGSGVPGAGRTAT
jgi:hypothetical protein